MVSKSIVAKCMTASVMEGIIAQIVNFVNQNGEVLNFNFAHLTEQRGCSCLFLSRKNESAIMQRVTYYVVLPFYWTDEGIRGGEAVRSAVQSRSGMRI